MKAPVRIMLLSLLVFAVGASSASAAPFWKFNGHLLVGSEKVVAKAINERFTIPGATTECAHATLEMEISNGSGASNTPGAAQIEKFLNEGCTAAANCSVESFEAKKLPWSAHLVTVLGKGDYLVIEGIELDIRYTGSLCAIAGLVVVKGSAGGLIDNAEQTITFNKASFEATGTALKVGATAIEWDALFATEALGSHKGEGLEG